MAKFRKKPIVVEATQWWKNGDHPQDGEDYFFDSEHHLQRAEGKVVRYFRHPEADPQAPCSYCGVRMHDHGWIDTPEGGHIVCPSDWVITGIRGEHYPCKEHIFEMTYEPVEGGAA